MSKNVAVFVDVANIFYAAKAAGVDIDYVTLLKAATAGRDFIRAYAYTGLDPENENQRQFHGFLARNGYKVVSKDIRKYGDGKVKANLDIELVVDMMKTARNVDIAVVVSGDGDFAPAIRAVQEMGVRVEVISFRGNTSSDLIDVADTFMDITQLAKVEKSSRSGRRVAASGEDLSMTAVPDKETEGAPRRRRRTTKAAIEETSAEPAQLPVAANRAAPTRAATSTGRGRGPATTAARSAAEAIAAAGVPGLRVLPGERLSRVGAPAGAEAVNGVMSETAEAPEHGEPIDEIAAMDDGGEAAAGTTAEVSAAEGPGGAERDREGRRRRRRRGGRGRGRGRGREQRELTPTGELPQGGEFAQGGESAQGAEPDELGPEGEGADAPIYAPLRPPQSAFGSVWDSQLGMNAPTRPAADVTPVDEEDLEEPEIPEYLLAERRRAGGGTYQGGRGRGRGPRGGRGAYAAALDRERYGRAGAPSTGWSADRGGRPDRGPRPGRRPTAGFPQNRQGGYDRPPSAEPWSEVPPDLEQQIRAQLAASRTQPAAPTAAAPVPAEPRAGSAEPAPAGTSEAPKPRRGPGRPRKAVAAEATTPTSEATPPPTPRAAPKRSAGTTARRTRTSAKTEAGAADTTAAPKRRTRAKKATEDGAEA